MDVLGTRFGSSFFLEGAVLTAPEVARSGCWMLSWDRAALEAVCFEGTVFTASVVALPGSLMLLRARFGIRFFFKALGLTLCHLS